MNENRRWMATALFLASALYLAGCAKAEARNTRAAYKISDIPDETGIYQIEKPGYRNHCYLVIFPGDAEIACP